MERGRVALVAIILGSLLITVFNISAIEKKIEPFKPPTIKKQPLEYSKTCKGCKEQIDKVLTTFFNSWEMSEKNHNEWRDLLHAKCNAINLTFVTKDKYPSGSRIGKMVVEGPLDKVLPDKSPFLNQQWDTCSIVGNGGILADSNCGNKIDSADFVFRCNLPPIKDFEKHVGNKTSLVTANRSILRLNKRKSPMPFLEKMNQFGDSMVLFSDLSYSILGHTVLALKELKSPFKPMFLDHRYLAKLKRFWSSKGVKERFVTSGLITVSMALEVCKHVNVFGFWPFSLHPFELYYLSHHYYDNRPPKPGVHNMSMEFEKLLNLHRDGVIKLYLNNCG